MPKCWDTSPRALWTTRQDAEYAAVLETLEALDAEVALDVKGWATPQRPLAPLPDLGSFLTLPSAEGEALRGRLLATLRRAYDNLRVLGETISLEHGVEPLRQAVAELLEKHPAVEQPFGALDVAAEMLATTVAPPRLDPVQLLSSEPQALHGILQDIDGGRLAEAETELRTLMASEEDISAAAQSLLGRLQAHRGEHKAAFETLHDVLETNRRDLAARKSLARLHWQVGDQDGALRELRHAAKLGALDRDLARVLARAEMTEGQLTAARRQWISLDKRFDSVEALLHLAEAARQSGGIKQGLDFTRRAVQRAPNSEDVLRRHVHMAWEAQLIQSAAQQVEPLVRMRPEVAEYRLWLGRVWTQRRQMGEASEALLEAVALAPDFTEAMLPLGLALLHESRFEEGRGFLQRYLDAHPDNLDALAGLAEAEERLGEAESAERRVLHVLSQNDGHARAHLVIGLLRSGRGEFAEARNAFQRAVDMDPWMAKAHYQLSLACTRLGDRDCAKASLQDYKSALRGPAPQFLELQSDAPEMQPMEKKPEEMQMQPQPMQLMKSVEEPEGGG